MVSVSKTHPIGFTAGSVFLGSTLAAGAYALVFKLAFTLPYIESMKQCITMVAAGTVIAGVEAHMTKSMDRESLDPKRIRLFLLGTVLTWIVTSVALAALKHFPSLSRFQPFVPSSYRQIIGLTCLGSASATGTLIILDALI